MAQTVRVYKIDMKNGLEEVKEVVEVSLQEAKKIMKDTYHWGCLVIDRKTNEVIREIAPNVEEINIIIDLPMGGG